MSIGLNAPSVGFADSSNARRWSILALRSSTAQRGRRRGRSPEGVERRP
jgi:hypothetical protein